MQEINSGWFVAFTPDEHDVERDLISYLSDNGYSAPPLGIKELLIDTLYTDDSKEKKVNPILDAINENPEAVTNALAGIGNLATSLLNKKIFKGK